MNEYEQYICYNIFKYLLILVIIKINKNTAVRCLFVLVNVEIDIS